MIVIRKNASARTFGSLRAGAVFEYEGDMYIKTDETSEGADAVNLENGELTEFYSNEEVDEQTTAVLVIE